MASYRPNAQTPGTSLTKAMVLVARLRKLADRPVPADERALMAAMIQRSDNGAANRLYATVGASSVKRLARQADMDHFELDTQPSGPYRLGDSKVTAADQARFFAQIDRLVPDRHRRSATELLGDVQEGRWGLLDAQLPGRVLSKAGWRPEAGGGGWTVTQAAQYEGPQGIAVLTAGQPDQAYGQESIRGVAEKLAVDQADQQPAGAASCRGGAGAQGDGFAGETVPGSKGKVLPNGDAVPPADAPEAVKQVIAAGNKINHLPYLYGGCHGAPLNGGCKNYDCSSAVSFALHGGGLFKPTVAQASPFYIGWAQAGRGEWVTTYSNPGHMYMVVAGLRFDTGGQGYGRRVPSGTGPRWSAVMRPAGGFVARHPPGL